MIGPSDVWLLVKIVELKTFSVIGLSRNKDKGLLCHVSHFLGCSLDTWVCSHVYLFLDADFLCVLAG